MEESSHNGVVPREYGPGMVCANEHCFEYKCAKISRLRPSTSFLKFQRRRPVENSAMKYKRYQLCLELFKTEINCLKTSDFLARLFEENVHVSAEANDIMFGVFGGMRKAHDGIVRRMGEVLDTWNDQSTIGDIFVEEASKLADAYSPIFPYVGDVFAVYQGVSEAKRKIQCVHRGNQLLSCTACRRISAEMLVYWELF
ncbi:hypothetical protein KIN20_016443 [Parelaphostrongylus tenuis]|uniref:Uncharacterized protein n=1 Tax=Parelaphostrongylus tenuis TaxID=148309 RepID=A0AAD5N1Y7_PARTN|nr:hypothetical protein KIN20_016443 [Parelaphostrongylus tenuis]